MKVLVMFVMMQFLAGCGCAVVDTGHRGIEVRFGELQGEPKPEGFYLYNPFTTSMKELDVREQKAESETLAYTHDTQTVKLSAIVIYSPDPTQIGVLYKQYGEDYASKIVIPIVAASIKSVVGGYQADEMIANRQKLRDAITAHITEKVKEKGIRVSNVEILNLDFNDAYEHAVEAKVIAAQKAAEAKNKTVEVEERAKQQVISAEAEARAMTIKSEALAKNRGLTEYEAILKWDGKLPQYMMGGAIPMIKLPEMGK